MTQPTTPSTAISFRVIYSDEDKEYVGLCNEFLSLSFLAKSYEDAFLGITELVNDVLTDIDSEKTP